MRSRCDSPPDRNGVLPQRQVAEPDVIHGAERPHDLVPPANRATASWTVSPARRRSSARRGGRRAPPPGSGCRGRAAMTRGCPAGTARRSRAQGPRTLGHSPGVEGEVPRLPAAARASGVRERLPDRVEGPDSRRRRPGVLADRRRVDLDDRGSRRCPGCGRARASSPARLARSRDQALQDQGGLARAGRPGHRGQPARGNEARTSCRLYRSATSTMTASPCGAARPVAADGRGPPEVGADDRVLAGLRGGPACPGR